MQGRKIKQEASVDAQAMDLVQSKIEEKEKSIAEVDALYLPEGENYNLHVVMERASFYQKQTADALIGLGKQMILIKAHEPHGQWLSVLERMGMSERSTQYAMLAARKFSKSENFSDLGRSKLIALSALDEESIEILDEGGKINSVGSLDDIDQMTFKELKSALRAEKKKRKEEREAQESAISQKEQKLNELEQELRYRQPPTKQDIAQAKVDELRPEVFKYLRNGIYNIGVVIAYMDKVCRVEDVTIDQIMKLTEVMNPHLVELKDAIDDLGDLFENAYPIKEEAPCTSGM